MRISDWSSDVCSSDLALPCPLRDGAGSRADSAAARPTAFACPDRRPEPSPAGRVALAEQEGPRSALAARGSGRGSPASQAGRLARPPAGGALRQPPPASAALPSAAQAGGGGGGAHERQKG